MISVRIPRINESEVVFPSQVSKNLPAGKTQRLALTITWWVWPEVWGGGGYSKKKYYPQLM